jgi:hypothetical protein
MESTLGAHTGCFNLIENYALKNNPARLVGKTTVNPLKSLLYLLISSSQSLPRNVSIFKR